MPSKRVSVARLGGDAVPMGRAKVVAAASGRYPGPLARSGVGRRHGHWPGGCICRTGPDVRNWIDDHHQYLLG